MGVFSRTIKCMTTHLPSNDTLTQLGFIGGGVMAEAILARIVCQSTFTPSVILVSDPLPQRREFLQQTYGVAVTDSNLVVMTAAPIVVLAIKPQQLATVGAELATQTSPCRLVLSILAGVTLAKLSQVFPQQGIIRAMPNTPATVGAGITAMAVGENVLVHDQAKAKQILEAIGQVIEVPESQLDAVTGLSGSGPGYLALVVEALSDGGVAAGLPRVIATQLAIQTVLGTAKLLHESGWHPAELKDRVTSPGGTTIAGITALEQAGVRAALIDAVLAATRRSKELGG
jgi:pyrroline-5-carboxylate reductase